jgi:hypothetical protein
MGIDFNFVGRPVMEMPFEYPPYQMAAREFILRERGGV